MIIYVAILLIFIGMLIILISLVTRKPADREERFFQQQKEHSAAPAHRDGTLAPVVDFQGVIRDIPSDEEFKIVEEEFSEPHSVVSQKEEEPSSIDAYPLDDPISHKSYNRTVPVDDSEYDKKIDKHYGREDLDEEEFLVEEEEPFFSEEPEGNIMEESHTFDDEDDDLLLDDEDLAVMEEEPDTSSSMDNHDFSAVLYEDSSGLVNYAQETAVVASDVSSYDNFRRIGDGEIIPDSHGFVFRTENGFYRFDSHRVVDLTVGKNFAALSFGPGQAVKLFIYHHGSNVHSELTEIFSHLLDG